MLKIPVRAAPRFLVQQPLRAGMDALLPALVANHMSALRMRPGDPVTLFNGEGGEFSGELVLLSKARTVVNVHEWHAIERESGLAIHLAQCISSGDRMDTALQKATELGVASITPVESERSIVRLSAERAARRLAHWRNVVIAACEQSGRNRVPAVADIVSLSAYVGSADPAAARLMLDPASGRKLRDMPPLSSVHLLAGAEGGLSDWEKQAAERAGFIPVRFGPRVMRTETAPLATIAAMQALWGDC